MTLEKTINGYYIATFHGVVGVSDTVRTAIRKAVETYENLIATPCPHNQCDGSGIITIGEFDNIEDVKCLCALENEVETEPDNQNLYE